MSFAFTPAQQRAIDERGGAILVSAAAGSGKTRVLTERLIARVLDPKEGADIDRFLVITYTRAAAAELRDRIMKALGERLGEHPEDRRLRRQQTLCCRAHIGTIHSFCGDLIRANCHQLGLPPRFTVMEQDRAATLRANVLSRLLDARYDALEADPAFRQLSDTVGAGSDDRRLADAVLELHDKLRAQPFPKQWAERQRAAFLAEGVSDAGETAWGRELLADAKRAVRYYADALEAALPEMAAHEEDFLGTTGAVFSGLAERLRELERALSLGWDQARECAAFPWPRFASPKKCVDTAYKERLNALFQGCKKACATIASDFSEPSEELLAELRELAPAMGCLLDLTLELDEAFSKEKLRRGSLDYGDLEHYAVRLLIDERSGQPTPLARETAEGFVEVMVDEFQDVSPIQERIFRALSRDERNLFLVGDVKQAIYRFRLADPQLFLDRLDKSKPVDEARPGEPRRIDLQSNFRSREAILTAANRTFSALLSRELGELEYDEAAALHFGARDYPAGTDVPPELCLIPTALDAEDETPEQSELEARFVAGEILKMMRERVQVYGPDGHRDCRWGDFVLLMRSPGGKGRVFHRVLAEQGIPVSSKQGDGFFTALEITVAINLLSLIDNPHADVPLISVLRSPLFAFTGDELALIRAGREQMDFYGAVCAAAEAGDAHCADFLRRLGVWRALAPDLELDRLLWRVCADTDLFAVCAAMADGEGRRQNLMRLFEYAAGFTQQGYRGVFRFVRWLRALAEQGVEPELDVDDNAVRILSIHKSKGLEFPFVFLCDLSHRFNKRDVAERVLMHTELGLGPKVTDAETGQEYPSLARRAIARRIKSELLSEELRVYYVALTRPRERLVMTVCAKDPEKLLSAYAADSRAPIPPETLRGAGDPGQWLLRAALLPDSGITVRVAEPLDPARRGGSPEPPAGRAAEGGGPYMEDPQSSEETTVVPLAARLDWSYPYAGTTGLPARLTATGLKRATDAEALAEDGSLLPRSRARRFRRPGAAGPQALTAAEQGVAAHSFLQYLDFSKTGSVEALRGERDRLTAAGRLGGPEAESVDLDAVARLFASPLGQEMRSAHDLRREFRFTLLSEAAEWFPEAAPEDRLLLQGVVDCFFVTEGAITIVDYKTDRVTAEEVPARAEEYRPQLRAYAAALERILGLPVRRSVLWFLRPGMAAEL